MKRRFRRFRDDRFALTTLQNPLCEVRTHAELVQAAQREREIQSQAAATPDTTPLAAPPAVSKAIPPPAPSAQPDPPKDALTAKSAPPPEKKRKPRPRKKSTPHRYTKRRRYAKRRRKPAPKRAPAHEEAAAEATVSPLTEEIEQVVAQDLDDDPALPALERHARKCAICHHPKRAGIEEHFLNWHNTDAISNQYGLKDFRPIYRHARATGLFQKRRANLRFAADLLIEHADCVDPTAEGVLRAIRISARINDEGQWIEPPSHVIVSSGGRVTAPQYGPLPQISMTQVVLPQPIPQPAVPQPTIVQPDFAPLEVADLNVTQPAAPAIESAETPQLGAVNHAEENHENLIGRTAIRNRRNPLKTKGDLPF